MGLVARPSSLAAAQTILKLMDEMLESEKAIDAIERKFLTRETSLKELKCSLSEAERAANQTKITRLRAQIVRAQSRIDQIVFQYGAEVIEELQTLLNKYMPVFPMYIKPPFGLLGDEETQG